MPKLARDRLTWLAYGQFAGFGYFFYGFGPVVPLLRLEQHTSRGVAGLHGTAFAVGGMLGGAVAPWLVRRLGRQTVAWSALWGLSGAALAFWVVHPLWATITLAAVSSVFGTLIANMVLATLSDHHGPAGPAAISEANAANAAVGLLAPLIVGAAVAAGLGWRPGLAVVVVVVAILAALAIVFRVRIPAARPAPAATIAGRVPRPYWLAWCCLIATGSVEVCLNLWVADELRTHSHASPGAATAAVAAIVAGMCAGRLVGGRLLLRWSAPLVLLGALAVSGVGFVVFWFAPTPPLAVIGLVVLGLGDAMHFPLGMSLAVEHSDGQPDLAVSRAAYATGLAFGVAPFVLGAIADSVGPHAAFLLVPVCLGVAAVIAWRLAGYGLRQPTSVARMNRSME